MEHNTRFEIRISTKELKEFDKKAEKYDGRSEAVRTAMKLLPKKK